MNTVWCEICQRDLDDDDDARRHRHLWQTEDGEWIGPGGVDMDDSYRADIRAAFHQLLRACPDIAAPLAATIRDGKMGFESIHLSGTIFGYDRVQAVFGGHVCGDALTQAVEADDGAAVATAVLWLISLDNDRTPDANQLTLDWIAEIQQRRAA